VIAAALAGPPLLVALVVLLARWASARRRDADEAHRNVLALLADQADDLADDRARADDRAIADNLDI